MSPFQHTTQELLRRFLDGEVGPLEEAELNKRARTDEALAEAMAGYREFPEVNHPERLERIRQNTPRRIVHPLRQRLSIAAGIFLIIAASLFVFNRSESLKSEDGVATEAAPMASSEAPLAAEKEASTTAETAPATQSKKAATNNPVTSTKEITSDAGQAPATPESLSPEEAAPSEEVTTVPPAFDSSVSADVPGVTLSAEADKRTDTDDSAPVSTLAREVVPAPAQRSLTTPASARIIRGYVTDDQDRPVNKANITLPGQPIGEYTDSSGYFTLATDRSVSRIEVNHPRFEGTEVALPRGENEVQISLSQAARGEADDENDWMFDGARTTIYPNRKKSSAAPVGGLSQLRKSIRNNKPAALPNGKVKVSFSVQPDGSLTNLEFGSQSEAALIPYVRNYLEQRSSWVFDGDEDNPVRMLLTFRFD